MVKQKSMYRTHCNLCNIHAQKHLSQNFPFFPRYYSSIKMLYNNVPCILRAHLSVILAGQLYTCGWLFSLVFSTFFKHWISFRFLIFIFMYQVCVTNCIKQPNVKIKMSLWLLWLWLDSTYFLEWGQIVYSF